ncbi:hypothetical protein F0562_001219 [Nyssa sinensis]|uniref:Uncharacterized protein n=1 Tax=Nyssa sinensis TaxID=561372 RepID=A0A5J5C2Y2_9ASTE|nr:hypothetical protein F0562_001219 [Nyssa sinensis]
MSERNTPYLVDFCTNHHLFWAGIFALHVSNFLWDYTNIVMNFLCGPQTLNGTSNFDWLQYFDVVITGRFGFGTMSTVEDAKKAVLMFHHYCKTKFFP